MEDPENVLAFDAPISSIVLYTDNRGSLHRVDLISSDEKRATIRASVIDFVEFEIGYLCLSADDQSSFDDLIRNSIDVSSRISKQELYRTLDSNALSALSLEFESGERVFIAADAFPFTVHYSDLSHEIGMPQFDRSGYESMMPSS